MFDAQTTARENLRREKIRSTQYYDRKTNPQTFKDDQYVYLKEPSKSKFDEQYTGPYKVLEILQNNNVKLAISNENKNCKISN